MDCATLVSITLPNTLTIITTGVFVRCINLTSITVPASVTSINMRAFEDCTGLVNVTFQGTISADKFGNTIGEKFYGPFPGDLRSKFYTTDAANGTPGTYTRPNGASLTWTKKQQVI